MTAVYSFRSLVEIWEINVVTGECGGLSQNIKEERQAAVSLLVAE